MKLKQEREYKQDYPVPSGFSPSTKTSRSRIPVALQSPLKSLKSSIRSASPKMTKKCHFIEQDSFVQGKGRNWFVSYEKQNDFRPFKRGYTRSRSLSKSNEYKNKK